MSEDPVDYAQVAEQASAAVMDEDRLERLSALSTRYSDLEQKLEKLEEETKTVKKEMRQIAEEDVPSLLDGAGLSVVGLSDGTRVEVSESFYVSTTGKYRDKINAWLVERGYDDLIKDEITVPFGRGQEGLVHTLEGFLRRLDRAWARKRYVESASFKALVKELLEDGEDVPLDQLGVHVQRSAKFRKSRK